MTAWQELSPAVFDAEVAAEQAAMEREAAATLFPGLPRPVAARPVTAKPGSKHMPGDVALFGDGSEEE